MAEHVLETRIVLRYATYSQWMNSEVILKQGEAAIAAFPNNRSITNSDITPSNTPPAIGIKIGDGIHYFEELPWVQGIAADVYNWAKSSSPPNATNIPGLNDYIESYLNSHGISGSGSGAGDTGIIYRIIYNNSKYILQQYDSEIDDWINTTSEINLTDIYTRIDTIERWANGARTNLGNIEAPILEYIYEEVMNYINRLDYDDVAVAHQFVTSVVEENGKISVTRSTITASDITGVIPTSQGGTGLTYVEDDEVLVGDRNGNITTRHFVTEIDENRAAFATVGAIKDYVAQQTAGITGAMHFVGESAVEITVNPVSRIDPNIADYNFRNAQPGDVILANNAQEFVWTGNYWRLLGDEGSYAIKGSITNTDIDENAAISQSKIDGLVDALANKVDVEPGKGLSTNDYTNEDKQKLANIEEGAQKNVIEHILLNDVEAVPHIASGIPNTVELTVKEFDDLSRAKLATIEENAQVNTIEGITLNGVSQAPDNNKIVNLAINEFSVEDKNKLDSIEANAQVNIIERVFLNDTEILPDNQKRIDINITGITQEQIDKLNSIEEGAQVNVIEGIVYDGTALSPDNHGIVTIEPDPHTEHENVIEAIVVNGTEFPPDQNKTVNITIDAPTLNLIHGAEVPNGQGGKEAIEIINKQLQFAAIAKSGDVKHLLQTSDTYILLNCGSSTDVI